MDEKQRAHLLGGLPEGQEPRVVKGCVVHLIVNHRPYHTQLVHCPVQLGDGGGNVLHRQRGKAFEAVGVVHGQLVDFIVAIPGNGAGNGRVAVIHIKGGTGGHHLHVHPQGVHVGNPLFRRPLFHRVNVGLVAVGGQAVPGLAGGNRPLKTLGFLVGMNVNGAQGGPPEFALWIGCPLNIPV